MIKMLNHYLVYFFLAATIVFSLLIDKNYKTSFVCARNHHKATIQDAHPKDCKYKLVQTIPQGLTFNKELPFEVANTHEVWLKLIKKAKKSIRITTFELTLLKGSTKLPESSEHYSMKPGEDIVSGLIEASRDRHVKVEIIYGIRETCERELSVMERAGIKLKYLDVRALTGAGVQHNKMIIVDDISFYLGSANWDWQSLSQVKELGISYEKCEPLAMELSKIFDLWSQIGETNVVKEIISQELVASFNQTTPFKVMMDDIETEVFFSVSPKRLDGLNSQRSDDLETILETINRAEKFVHISVMNYSPMTRISKIYHPEIENALKRAHFERGVDVKMLFSIPKNRKLWPNEVKTYKSFDSFRSNSQDKSGISVKLYKIPPADDLPFDLPYTRVKHDKYVVTDNSVYIGTSNWTPDYFQNTCGVGISVRPNPETLAQKQGTKNIVSNLEALFSRDFESPYATYATDYN